MGPATNVSKEVGSLPTTRRGELAFRVFNPAPFEQLFGAATGEPPRFDNLAQGARAPETR